MKIQIQEEDFDVSKELELLRVDLPQIGGINVFVGTVRDEHFGLKIEGMVLEHYPGMTEKSLANILDQAQARWQILNATVNRPTTLFRTTA